MSLGKTRVTPQKFGKWEIESFHVSEYDAKIHNVREMIRTQNDQFFIDSGDYLRLRENGSWHPIMSNTPMEVRTNHIAYKNAKGNVLIAGLGIGMILEAILSKPDVTHIQVVEIDKDIVDYVGSFFKDEPKVSIIHDDIFNYKLKKNEHYDYVWLDIWGDVCDDNISEMEILNEKFQNHCDGMNIWSTDLLDADLDQFSKIMP